MKKKPQCGEKKESWNHLFFSIYDFTTCFCFLLEKELVVL